ncbi:MAG: Crp/Fnr family transcriptional regulator [Bacteroidales bacterium]|nr:Crp/Fnr family transcriptional regulator [Bacteroidales bacterium]
MEDTKVIFIELFRSYTDLPLQSLDELFSLLKIRTINKGTDLVYQGKSSTKDYFLLNGILREFLIDDNGNEVTVNFYYNKSFITPNFCRIENKISSFTIQALSNCVIAEIESAELEKYRNRNVVFFNASALIITKLFKDNIERQIVQATYSAKKRLEQFRAKFPGIENYVPHSFIASYLGITNVSLSRLRKLK